MFALAVVGLVVAGEGSALAAFPGANGRILFDSTRAACCGEEQLDIWTMTPTGSGAVNLTAGSEATDLFGRWSPDGRRIVFQSDRETPGNPVPPGFSVPDLELFVMNANGASVKQLTFNELDDEAPAWAPNGNRIVFQRDLDPVKGQVDYDIFVTSLAGNGEHNLTRSPSVNESAPAWAPDKQRIAFDGDREGDAEIYTMNPGGSQVIQLTSNNFADYGPNWSPDGSKVAFTTDRLVTDENFNLEVFAMRADGSGQLNLSRHPFIDELPAWSPDGSKIAFHTDRDSTAENPFDFEIYTMRADGGNQINRTNNPAFDGFPDWQPLAGR